MASRLAGWHQVAHAPAGMRPLASASAADWLWTRLRRACSPSGTSAAAVLMPDHLHVVHSEDPERLRRALAGLVGAFARGGVGAWVVPPTTPITGRDKLLRQVRYVHLNPCRAGLCRDPLSWPWSTHRDAVGAVYNPWLRLAWLELDALPASSHSSSRRFHRYVSSDPSVHPSGTPFPKAAMPSAIPLWGLGPIWSAAVSSSPCCGTPKKRERFVFLAARQGWRHSALMGQAADISAGQVRRLLGCRSPMDLSPAALCLGDVRLDRADLHPHAPAPDPWATRQAR